MNEDEARAALAEALHERLCKPLTGAEEPCQSCRDDAAALLPVVRHLAAEQRERARAPFLAVADEIHRRGTAEVAAMDDEPDEHRKNQCASRASTYARAEHLIRRAAEETTE